MNQAEKILKLLEEAGDQGVTNIQLNHIAFRYGARLHDLRRDGNKISTIYVKPGVFKFVLHKPKKRFLDRFKLRRVREAI